MYRVLIVDDNPWDRKGIQKLIDWEDMEIDIVGSSINGKQALEMVENVSPDIIIADVAMPVMNGIQMAHKLKESHPEIKIIFMSGYNEFDFVKSAIDLDIYGYVLKPVMPDELLKALNKILKIYRVEHSRQKEIDSMMRQIGESLPMVQEQFFRELIFGNYSDLEDIRKRIDFLRLDLFNTFKIHILYLQVKEYYLQTENTSMTDKYLIPYVIKNILGSFNSNICSVHTVQISSSRFVSLVFERCSSEANGKVSVLDIAVQAHEEIFGRLGLYSVIGISKSSKNFKDIPRLYSQSETAAGENIYSECNPIIMYSDIEEIQNGSLEDKLNMELLYKEVKSIISSGNEEDIAGFVEKYLDTVNSSKTEGYVKSLTFSIVNAGQIALIEAGQSFKDIFEDEITVWKKLCDFDNIKDVKQWIINMFRDLQEGLESKVKTRNSKIVDDIKEFIRKKYQDQITLNDIAESIYMSSKQANNIFKKEMGKTIFDYITEYRIETARKLLKDPYCKVYLVADQVGYTNKSHFCLLFKKHTGLSPMEYKNKPF